MEKEVGKMVALKTIPADKRMVQFTRPCSPYLTGERALFGIREAAKIVGINSAFYVKQNKKGEWVRDNNNGEEDDQSAEQPLEQADTDGQTNKDADTDDTGDAGSEGGEGSGDDGGESEGSTETEKKPRARRQRAKL